MTGQEFLEWSGRTITPASSIVVGVPFQMGPQERVEALVLTYLEAVKERAVELVHEIISHESQAPSRH